MTNKRLSIQLMSVVPCSLHMRGMIEIRKKKEEYLKESQIIIGVPVF